jgi:hypothetical protein
MVIKNPTARDNFNNFELWSKTHKLIVYFSSKLLIKCLRGRRFSYPETLKNTQISVIILVFYWIAGLALLAHEDTRVSKIQSRYVR